MNAPYYSIIGQEMRSGNKAIASQMAFRIFSRVLSSKWTPLPVPYKKNSEHKRHLAYRNFTARRGSY